MTKRTLVLFFCFLLLAVPVAATTPWTTKPPLGTQINWSHPLARGLIACWLLNERNGNIINNLTSPTLKGTFSAGTASPTWKGDSLYFDGGDTASFGDATFVDGLKALTVFTIFVPRASANIATSVIRKDGSCTPLQFYSSNGIRVALWTGGTLKLTWITQALTIGRTYAYTMRWGASFNSGYPEQYLDNVLKTPSTKAACTGVLADSATGLYFGSTGSAEYFNGDLKLVYYWNRLLTREEIASLHYAPYQFIEYKPWTMWGAITEALSRRRFM
jgi:hypothetical protein